MKLKENQPESKMELLSVDIRKAVEQIEANRLLEMRHWQSLKVKLARLNGLIERLTQELACQREAELRNKK